MAAYPGFFTLADSVLLAANGIEPERAFADTRVSYVDLQEAVLLSSVPAA